MCALCGFYGGYTLGTVRQLTLREIDALRKNMVEHYQAMGGE